MDSGGPHYIFSESRCPQRRMLLSEVLRLAANCASPEHVNMDHPLTCQQHMTARASKTSSPLEVKRGLFETSRL